MTVINKYTEEKRKENLKRLKTYDKEALIECIVNQGDSILDLTEQILPENYELKHRINKVIEYIESNEKEYGSLEDNEKIILDILRGEDNE